MSSKKKETVLDNHETFDVLMAEARAAVPNRQNMRSEAIVAKALPVANVNYIDMKFAGEVLVKVETKEKGKDVVKYEKRSSED